MDKQIKANPVTLRPDNISGKSNYLFLLDAGHGGMKDGKYTTAPAKMFTFPDGYVIYEGVVNRSITHFLALLLDAAGIDYAYIHDEDEDTPLFARVQRADNWHFKDKRAVYLSIHSNSGGGSGFEVFTSKGQTKSDKVANVFCDMYQKMFPDKKFRADSIDGDADKEADFYVLRKTDCPAILVENLFFDNRQEAEFLNSEIGQQKIAICLEKAIQAVEKLKPI